MLLEEWLNLESSFGELGDIDLVRAKLPKKLKKRRQIETEDGPAGYVDSYLSYKLHLFVVKMLVVLWDPLLCKRNDNHLHFVFAMISILECFPYFQLK